VVMARPMKFERSGNPSPKLNSPDPYTQVVTWQVLYSWKGTYQPDDRFVTTININPSDPCVGWDKISDHQPRLVYISDYAPHKMYYSSLITDALPELKFLQKQEHSGR